MSKYRNAYCSFCKKGHETVGPLVEGPGEVYICGECIELTQSIILQEKFRRSDDPDGYFQTRINQLTEAVEREVWTSYPRLLELGAKAAEIEIKGPPWIIAIYALYESTALLSIVSDMLERIKTKGLNSEELALLEDVARKVAQLRAAVNAQADKELEGLS
jgi:hypothetical protein